MIVTCVYNLGDDLADHQRGRFTMLHSEYPLTKGAAYVALGMGVWETILEVLVRDDWGKPLWCPLGLFDCPPQPMPADWAFTVCDGLTLSGTALWTRWVARWGYEELVRDPGHSDALMERDPAALAIFSREVARQEGERSSQESR
jgi:hypothetical protein